MININLLRLFVKVAETRNIASAARFFGITPSVASRQLYALERDFKTKLLSRTTRRLSLTDAGVALLEYAKATTSGYETLSDELGAMQQKPSGLVRIACTEFSAFSFLPNILLKFRTQYPDVRVQVQTSSEPTKLLDGVCDVALCSGRMPDVGLVARRIRTYSRLLCASRSYLAKRKPPTSLADLVNHTCIAHISHERTSWAFQAPDGDIVIQNVQPSVEVDNYLVLARFLVEGLGIGRISETLFKDEISSGNVVQLLPDYKCVYADGGLPGMWIVFPDRRILNRTRLLADFLGAELG